MSQSEYIGELLQEFFLEEKIDLNSEKIAEIAKTVTDALSVYEEACFGIMDKPAMSQESLSLEKENKLLHKTIDKLCNRFKVCVDIRRQKVERDAKGSHEENL